MTDVFAGFRPPCWCPCTWAPAWRLHTNLYKFGENVSSHIFYEKSCCDLNLGESLCICTFFLFPDSGLDLLNGFDFLFWSILNGVTLKTSNSEGICLQTLTSFFAHARKITDACGWQKLFRPGQILYSRTNFQRDFRQVSILGFPLNLNSEALSWYSNFPAGFRMKSSIYVKRQSFEVREFSVISFVLIAFCQP